VSNSCDLEGPPREGQLSTLPLRQSAIFSLQEPWNLLWCSSRCDINTVSPCDFFSAESGNLSDFGIGFGNPQFGIELGLSR